MIRIHVSFRYECECRSFGASITKAIVTVSLDKDALYFQFFFLLLLCGDFLGKYRIYCRYTG